MVTLLFLFLQVLPQFLSYKFVEPDFGRDCKPGENGNPGIRYYFDHETNEHFPFLYKGCGGDLGNTKLKEQISVVEDWDVRCPGYPIQGPTCIINRNSNKQPELECAKGFTCSHAGYGADFGQCCNDSVTAKLEENKRRPQCEVFGLREVGELGRNCSHRFCPTRSYCIQGEFYAYCCEGPPPTECLRVQQLRERACVTKLKLYNLGKIRQRPDAAQPPAAPQPTQKVWRGRRPSQMIPTEQPTERPSNKNYSSISYDLLLMVDGGKNIGGQATFNETKELAIKILEKIKSSVVTRNSTEKGGTRLALNSLTQINSGNILQPWFSDAATVISQLRSLPYIQLLSTRYAHALSPLLDNQKSMFLVKNTDGFEYQNARPNAQRLLIVISNNVPVDLEALKDLDFTKLDIHPIFIAYRMDQRALESLGKAVSGWSVFPASDNSERTVNKFISDYLMSAEKVCANTLTEKTSLSSTDNVLSFIQVPKNYKLVKSNKENWIPDPQTARYCNYQRKIYDFKALNGKICFTVYYELEPEKDFLRFYQLKDGREGEELVALTGLDVSGTIIRTAGDVRVKFETDESDVRGGFYMSYGQC